MLLAFFNWNLTVERMLLAFSLMSSLAVMVVGNLPARFKPGPNKRGICGIKVWEAMKASKERASFLTIFLFLFNFFKSSTDLNGMSNFWAVSQWLASPRTQIFMRGRGTCGSLTTPEKRLSRWVS